MTTRKRISVVQVRRTRPRDFDSIIELTRQVYPLAAPWRVEQLESHLKVFPEGQQVAVDESDVVVGISASLIVRWDDDDIGRPWRDFTAGGMFTNHDPGRGHTLYGAELTVAPERRSCGIGALLYSERKRLTEGFGLHRILAGAPLAGYWRVAQCMTAREYAIAVTRGEMHDPTLSFQLKQGFKVRAVVSGYLAYDPHSLGYSAVIEWINSSTVTIPRRARSAEPVRQFRFAE